MMKKDNVDSTSFDSLLKGRRNFDIKVKNATIRSSLKVRNERVGKDSYL